MEEKDINTGIALVDNLLKGNLPPVEVKVQSRNIAEIMLAVVLTVLIIFTMKKYFFSGK